MRMRMTTRLVATVALLAALATTHKSCACLCGDGGTVCFVPIMNSTFDPYTSNPTPAQQQNMVALYSRAMTFPPYFDSRTSWFPNAWAYIDSYAIYTGSALVTQHPEWILKDGSGNKLYIPFGCSGGTCPQYAGDIGNPAFRSYMISQVTTTVAKGYRGLFFDDVNLDLSRVGDGNGNPVAPIDSNTHTTMSNSAWQGYFATYVEAVRAALPDKEITHNNVWFLCQGAGNTICNRVIAAADYTWMERGFNDTGIVGGSGTFGFNTFLSFIDSVHPRGVVLEPGSTSLGQEYALATYFLVSGPFDGLSSTLTAFPDNFSPLWQIKMGAPTGARTTLGSGVLKRVFAGGFVLVNPPGNGTQVVSLGGTYKRLDNSLVSSVTLGATSGAVLRNP